MSGFYYVAMLRNNQLSVHGCFNRELPAYAKADRLRKIYRYCDIRVVKPDSKEG